MKKFFAMMLVLLMVLAALVGCGGNTTPGGEVKPTENQGEQGGDKPDVSGYKVAMITDYGDITDQSFNQTTYEACKAFCEGNAVDFKYYKPTDDSTAARVEMIDQAIADRKSVV